MEYYPVKKCVVDITPIDARLFGWLRFEGNRNWIKLDEKPLKFQFSITARDDELHSWEIGFRNQSDSEIQFEITELDKPEGNVTDFPNLEAVHKRFFSISIYTSNKNQVFTCTVKKGQSTGDVFSFFPNLNYPGFLFSACQLYLPRITAKPFPNFVETGTLFGHTSIHASNWFENVHSIELSSDLFNELPIEWAEKRGIKFYHGDSSKKLPNIISVLEGPTVFFLDSHWSGDQSVDWANSTFTGYPMDTAHTGSGDMPTPSQQKPIVEEIELILSTFQEEALLIIDDWQLFGVKDTAFKGMDWTHINKLSIIDLIEMSPRTMFHTAFGAHRYVVGLSKAT